MSDVEQELRDKIAKLEQELKNRPKALSERDFERLDRAVEKFNEARDLLAQAQQCLAIEFHILVEKLDEVRDD